MNYYLIKSLSEVRGVGPAQPPTEKEKKFIGLWQEKLYAEAIKTFPDNWVWFSEKLSKEAITDMPPTFFMGLVFSKKSFTLAVTLFPIELKNYHYFNIENNIFVWVSPPVIDLKSLKTTNLNLFTTSPSYAKYASQTFVDFYKNNGLTGRDFVLAE